MVKHEENQEKRHRALKDGKRESNMHTRKNIGNARLQELESKESTCVIPRSPLITVKIDQNKPSDNATPSNTTNFPISPYPQTPKSQNAADFSPLTPSSSSPWLLPPPPDVWYHPFVLHCPPYGDPVHHSSRYHTTPGTDKTEKSMKSDDSPRLRVTKNREEKVSHSYNINLPTQGYYPPFPYHPGPHYYYSSQLPKSPSVQHHSPFPPYYYPPATATYTYPYLPSSETQNKERAPYYDPGNDEAKCDGSLVKSKDPPLSSPIQVKPRPVHFQSVHVTDEKRYRRERKNTLSRLRAQKKREQIEFIRWKPKCERTEEESRLLHQFDSLRDRKNDRSRERSTDTKKLLDIILQKPQDQRSENEVQFLETHSYRKLRKIEGDRMRRERMKALGLPSGTKAPHIRVTARGALPMEHKAIRSSHKSDQHVPYTYPYPPSFASEYPHYLAPPPSLPPHFYAVGGTSFTSTNEKENMAGTVTEKNNK